MLTGIQDTTFELERVVPMGNHVVPFIWLTTDADIDTVLDAFETKLIDRPSISDVQALDRIENGALYRLTWQAPDEAVIDGIVQTDATVLEARSQSGARWEFRVRFSDHDDLGDFQNILTENNVMIHIERIYTSLMKLTDNASSGSRSNNARRWFLHFGGVFRLTK
ncbi:bacterio-opsin activator domain-containing protein [Haloterrigena sp. H1]|uniref:bacterio-opsin activator domain-containing protein n=1 Tax=Haloterrigena sp. H1 TaxID=2552943 RepID=UPI002017C120|nr:bacterio-opsin activator domain-containing protein [Haloterrigena sp. H1]